MSTRTNSTRLQGSLLGTTIVHVARSRAGGNGRTSGRCLRTRRSSSTRWRPAGAPSSPRPASACSPRSSPRSRCRSHVSSRRFRTPSRIWCMRMLAKDAGTAARRARGRRNSSPNCSGERRRLGITDLGSCAANTVGRAAERETLRRAYARVKAGTSLFVAVTGEPGIGKSTLTEDFLIERNAVPSGRSSPAADARSVSPAPRRICRSSKCSGSCCAALPAPRPIS